MSSRSIKVGKEDNTATSDDEEYMSNMANNLINSCRNCENYQSNHFVKIVNNILTNNCHWRWSDFVSIFRSWDNFWVTGDLLVGNGLNKKILIWLLEGVFISMQMVFSASNILISFLSCFAFNIFCYQWPCGIQRVARILYKFLKSLKKKFFWYYVKIWIIFKYYFYFCVLLSISWVNSDPLVDKEQ